jgi:hypothetical protein
MQQQAAELYLTKTLFTTFFISNAYGSPMQEAAACS